MKLVIIFALLCFVFVINAATVPLYYYEADPDNNHHGARTKRSPLILTALGLAALAKVGLVAAGVAGAGLLGAGLVGAGLGAKAGLAAGAVAGSIGRSYYGTYTYSSGTTYHVPPPSGLYSYRGELKVSTTRK